jgi:hypothetical protein
MIHILLIIISILMFPLGFHIGVNKTSKRFFEKYKDQLTNNNVEQTKETLCDIQHDIKEISTYVPLLRHDTYEIMKAQKQEIE